MSRERRLLERVMYRIPSLVISEHDLDLVDEIKELLAQPEVEPLSEDEIRTIVNQLPTEVHLDTGIEFCRIIEKAHGITGGGK